MSTHLADSPSFSLFLNVLIGTDKKQQKIVKLDLT